MKQLIRVSASFCMAFLFFIQSASASVPYHTETMAADGSIIKTQTAYKPLGQFLPDAGFSSPEDIYADSAGMIYIADSGTKQIIVGDEDGTVKAQIGEGILGSPTGVFVDENNEIYVADYEKEKIFRFSEDGKLLAEVGKPDSPLFGKTSPFKPQKVSVDRRGNIYVISEGSTNGIIQLNKDGEFMGYYGVNSTGVSFTSFLQNLFSSEKQRARMFMKTPPAPDNIAIDDQGLIYSVTEGTKNEVIKKLNVAGKNMLSPDISDVSNYQDITVDPAGNIFVISGKGKIHEFDSFGNLLFIFGGKDDGSNRLGLFKQPTGIAIGKNGRLYVSDKERGMVQVFESTSFSDKVHEGIALFKEGLYVKSQKHWESVLELNSSFGLAHVAMGRAYYKQQQYENALEEFKFAEAVDGYSDSFWEVRHKWMQDNLGTVFSVLIGAAIVYYLIKFLDKRMGILNAPRKGWQAFKRIRIVSELLFLFRFFRHPIDSFYDLKRNGKASVLSATILYMILIIEFLLSRFQTGFIFTGGISEEVSLGGELAKLVFPLLLFIIVNYMVSTINDGEGRFKDIYIGTVYSLAPYLVFIVPVILVSNILTLNEAFVYIFSTRIIYAWCLVILVIMIKEIHNFSFSETVRNIFVTLFGMGIMVLVIFIIFVLGDQVYDFVYSVLKEAVLRV
ncbi:YIP1 family protein [Neobacillus sp. YIM B06451]|uniref:YIP1 family protein n=1 Tax=Neobacillus sp. YIM B06451 TaxID=3070994 RepID=UPI00293091FC|nr:YIP1 family protein [Neobacillus sp. YIM B06451]